MCDTTFTIGQRGGFHFECPSQWKLLDLPPKVQSFFKEDKVSSVYNLVLGQAEVYFISYKGKDGFDHISSDGLPERLRDFLYEKDSSGSFVRSFPGLRVSLGPYNQSFFVTDTKRMRWWNLPKGLDQALEGKRDSDGTWKDAPRLVVLGSHDNYVMITENNAASWQLSGYRELDAYMDAFNESSTSLSIIHNVFLNPYRLHNWILHGTNGTVIGDGMPSFAQASFETIKLAIKTDTEAQLKRELEAQQLTQKLNAQRAAAAQNELNMSRLIYQNNLAQLNQLNRMNQMLQAQTALNNAMLMNSFTVSNPFDMSAFWAPILDAASMNIY